MTCQLVAHSPANRARAAAVNDPYLGVARERGVVDKGSDRLPRFLRSPSAEIELDFTGGGTIWTESSYKFRPDDLVAQIERVGFRSIAQWIEPEDRFALTLFRAV